MMMRPLIARALGAAAGLAVLAGTALAVPTDGDLTLGEVELPVYMNRYDSRYRQPAAAYPISAARAPAAGEEQVRSVSTKDVTKTWTLAAWTLGRTLSEQPQDARIGDCCADLPFAADEIDWQRTQNANAAAVADGRVVFNFGAANATERVIFTAGGATELVWVSREGEEIVRTYEIGNSTSARPYRIYATRVDEVNTAAFIDLSGKFVKFFGDANLLRSEYAEVAPGVSNVVYGVDYDPSKTKFLTVRYRVDEQTGTIECPQGQFVLGYYDTETKDHLIAHVVVEICPPNVTTLNAEVGDCIRPVGGGYGTERLYAAVASGLQDDDKDPCAPYLEQYSAQEGEEQTDPDHGKLFAIAPTDVTTSSAGMAMPWKADVYWQTEDPMKTRWTFEHDWYLVSWPVEPLRVVVAPTGAPAGCPFLVPTNYLAKTGFRMPATVSATVSDTTGEVKFGGEDGDRILLKLLNATGTGCPAYLPVELTDYRSASVATPWAYEWPVGIELTPRIGVEAGAAARAMSERVDDNLPGFIYEPESKGRNWNPRLYHPPAGDAAWSVDLPSADAFSPEGVQQTADPYASLKSAIYGVNGSSAKIQVWWRANFQSPQMSVPVTYPALVQNYVVSWTTTMAPGLLPEIALSSQLGSSATNLTACSGRSLLLAEPSSRATVDLGGARLETTDAVAFAGFSCHVSPDGMATPGRLLRLGFGENGAADAGFVEAHLTRGVTNDFEVVFTVTSAEGMRTEVQPVVAGEWTDCAVELPAALLGHGVTAVYGAGATAEEPSATFVALDKLALWYGDPSEYGAAVYNFTFSANDLATLSTNGTARSAIDAGGNRLLTSNCAVAGAGAPEPFALKLKAEGDVKPEIYYENDRTAVGYNPNEEHAFVLQDQADGGYTVWALRDDLNTDETSRPVVMVMYAQDGKGRMQAYTITRTSEDYPRMASTALAGQQLLPPAPIGRMAGAQTSLDTAVSAFSFDDNGVVYRDRKNTLWARRDGIALARYGYPMQEGFCFPSLETQPKAGTPIAWLACDGVVNPGLAQITNIAAAANWAWTVKWPEFVPELKLGQVLTKAALGLPEVWNAASMAVCYPNPSIDANGQVGGPTVVKLIDPTVVQTSSVSLPVKTSFPDEWGFVLGPSGTTFLRKGKYYFTGLPPSISDRFYVTVEQGEAVMNLLGQYVEKESGGSYLELNVLTDEERAAIKRLCTLDPALRESEVDRWNAAADALAVQEVDPSPRTNFANPIKSTGRQEVTLAFPSSDLYLQWADRMTNDTSEVSRRFVVSQFVSDFGTVWQVVGGKAVTNQSNVAFATWHETDRKRRFVWSSRHAAAKSLYEAMGLNTYLETEWDEISSNRLNCHVTYVKGYFTWETTDAPAANTYLPRDHYALLADGTGTGYVTLIENDNPDPTQVSDGLPVKMSVIKVVPELYTDGIAVLSDSLNKLSEKLTLLYRTPLGTSAKDFEFQWQYVTPLADGTVPAKGAEPWQEKATEPGLVSVQLGLNGANLQDYVNTYYTLRYRPLKGTAAWNLLAGEHPDWTDEQFWSAWSDEQLAEGWLQRVFNGLTPFAQRVEDFYANASDLGFSMLEQIGRPYQGDVALNNDNLSQIGLLELYQTVFNRAESLLIAAGGNNIDMSKQLILARTRLGEFYTLLGAEAYSDAKNPLISAGPDGMSFASGTFSFANQVPSLLDEELALLRGRTAAVAFPRMTEPPLYNRLAWNLTKGLTEGEPAYVANYGIRARNGILDVNCAAVQYPQGHGDAWGHYLSALKGYYRLLRNPYFDWTTSMSEMLMDQKLMNVDYQDEQKFAEAAVRLVQTGTDAMDLTLRKVYKENPDDVKAGYFDANAEQAFGYGEWATRTGMAAAYSWMTANALLPTNDAPYQAFTDRGVAKITRGTATQLPALAASVRAVETRLNGFDAGANPLGLSEHAIPFDIDPDRLASKVSHFEQILERAEQALANCETVLGYAGVYGARLAKIADDEDSAIEKRQQQEETFNNRLIAIYGTPFSGDIGPGGTYPQGYDGPDLYNYTYMDLAPYGIDAPLETQFTNSFKLVEGGLYGWKYMRDRDWDGERVDQDAGFQINYIVNDGGIRLKPATITGSRRMEGSIQTAYRKYIDAYFKVQEKIQAYDLAMEELKAEWSSVLEQTIRHSADTAWALVKAYLTNKTFDTSAYEYFLDLADLEEVSNAELKRILSASVSSINGQGMTVNMDPRSIKDAATATEAVGNVTQFKYIKSAVLAQIKAAKTNAGYVALVDAIKTLAEDASDDYRDFDETMDLAAQKVNLAYAEIQPALGELSSAEAAYRAEIAKGDQIQQERALWRQQVSNTATEQRYLDMYNRVQRNLALTKYSTSFDTAQRYVWELAKVYDYETGLLSDNPQSGKQFLADIIATRSLGQEGVSISSGTTDGGLYDIVNRMKANWSVLKPRLGINNPDKPAKWFSLRRELFRIKDGEEGDKAWRKELEKYRVDNILTNPEFRRHCQPPASSTSVVYREPGYIIPFSTSIDNARNFFGKDLQAGDGQFSSADYATKIAAVGVDLVGLDRITNGGALEPNIYLVPIGLDYMRSPAGNERALLSWNVVDQVLPLPYAVGSTELNDPSWISTFSGLDGTSDSTAVIRRHSTMRAGGDFKSTRLVGRSAWNDRWLIVIPASALDADRDKAMKLIEANVQDIRLGVKAYARQGN